MQSMTFEELLRWNANRALMYYDASDIGNAVESFRNDLTKDPRTVELGDNPLTVIALTLAAQVSRHEFEKCMLGFK